MTERPPKYGALWTDEAKRELLELFEQGLSAPEIAEATGRNVNGIVGQLERMGKVTNVKGIVYRLEYWYDNRRKK